MKRALFPIAALAVLFLSAFTHGTPDRGEGASPPKADPAADSLVEAWISALGGMDTYARLQTARYTLTTELYDAASGRLKRTRPRYVTLARTPAGEMARIERWEGDDFIEQRWNGRTAWAARNATPLGSGDKDFDETPYVAGDVNYWIALPFKLRDPGVFLQDRGRDAEGRRVVAVTFGEDVGLHDDTWQYFFAKGRVWPVEVRYREEGKTNWNRLRFEDIRKVDGYVFVGRRVYFNDRGQTTKVLYTHDFELNPNVDPAVFERP